MSNQNFIEQSLYLQGYPFAPTELPYIESILTTIRHSQISLQAFPDLHAVSPITIFDKEVICCQNFSK